MGFFAKLLKQMKTFPDDVRNDCTVYLCCDSTLTCELCLFLTALHTRPSCQFSFSSSWPDTPGSCCLVSPPCSSHHHFYLCDQTILIFTSCWPFCSTAPNPSFFSSQSLQSSRDIIFPLYFASNFWNNNFFHNLSLTSVNFLTKNIFLFFFLFWD